MTTIGEARDIARYWVEGTSATIDGFHGAYVTGSAAWLSAESPLAPSSDVDVTVVLDTPVIPGKTGKFRYQDILLDVSFMPAGQLDAPERILADYHLAGTFRHTTILADPSGALAALQAEVTRHFAERRWVWRRCEQARDKVLAGLDHLDPAASLSANAIGWAFPTGVTCHILLAAGLRSPTIRTRYLAVRSLLADHGRPNVYASLLDLLGCAEMTPARATRHLDALADVFDAASPHAGAVPFPFASDITAATRPIAIDGSRELIARGDHREAVFWLLVTWSRCLLILERAAPAAGHRFEDGYRELLADLGVATYADLEARAGAVRVALPGIMAVAEAIIEADPEVAAG